MKDKFLTILIVVLSLALVGASAAAEHDWVCVPGKRVGPITRTTRASDLFKMFGKENVKRTIVELGEGATRPGTSTFPGTANEISIPWKNDKYQAPEMVIIEKPGTKWKTSKNITIGTTLDGLVKINKRHFKLYGYAWDGAGLVTSWEKGELERDHKIGERLAIQLGITREVPWKDSEPVRSSQEFRSDNRTFAKLGLRVMTIKIMFP